MSTYPIAHFVLLMCPFCDFQRPLLQHIFNSMIHRGGHHAGNSTVLGGISIDLFRFKKYNTFNIKIFFDVHALSFDGKFDMQVYIIYPFIVLRSNRFSSGKIHLTK